MDDKMDKMLSKLDHVEARLSIMETHCIDKSFSNEVNQSNAVKQQEATGNVKESIVQDGIIHPLMKLAVSLQDINMTMVNQALAMWSKKNQQGKDNIITNSWVKPKYFAYQIAVDGRRFSPMILLWECLLISKKL